MHLLARTVDVCVQCSFSSVVFSANAGEFPSPFTVPVEGKGDTLDPFFKRGIHMVPSFMSFSAFDLLLHFVFIAEMIVFSEAVFDRKWTRTFPVNRSHCDEMHD